MSTQALTLLGDRVVVQLDELADHTITDAGIVVPLFQNIESDGGRPDTKVSNLKYLPKGTIVNISQFAKERLPELNIGDRVFVVPSVVAPAYQFFSKRNGLVENFEGTISIPHTYIEAKIN